MGFKSQATKAMALVASMAAVVALAACGGNGGNTATSGTAVTEEPQAGVESNYTGTFPKPAQGKAYNNPTDRDKVKDGGTLTLGIGEIGPDWNMQSVNGNSVDMSDLWAFYMPQLYTYSADGGTVEPNTDYLTKVEQTSDSPETIVYTLNDKATWNDGTPIDYTAFVATWKAMNGEDSNYTPASTDGYRDIASVERGSTDKEVKVTFKTPFYPYQTLFAKLLPPQSASADTFVNGWQKNPHSEWGAGPYKVESFSDTEVVFTPNEKWWGNKAKLDKVTFRQMEDSAEINAFKNGEIDAALVGTADKLKTVKSMDNVQIRRAYGTSVSTYTINTKNVPDVNVRKALVQAIDRASLASIGYAGTEWTPDALPGSVLIPTFQKGYEDNMPADAAFSADNAKKTLEAAGYTLGSDGYYAKDGQTLDLKYTTFSDSATTKAVTNAIIKMGKDAGIKIEGDIKASADFSTTLSSGDFQILGLGWGSSDPFNYVYGCQIYCSTSESNYSFTGNDDVDSKMQSITGTEDGAEALKNFNEAEKEAQKLYAQIPYSAPPITMAVKKGLANFGPAGYATSSYGIPLFHTEDIGWTA
ncbi:ABC transporter family substrate-binding protein [Bifidobacterium avesanii]|uniref:ABC transporter family substrate-binding protein n=1 Tax=Bifidobacterium avesanii TaxID=1798157 RepID=A0A7K3TIF9_9BIFI|nr:ABC transporter family substrate-binding protein [Bifidobacterium avesanii]KAB8289897.1 peptide ABC transporter substrate-binding protein [Bifidobacterium avesanii]NEG78862.1 ABC transporter family substrate-binding protein [Bifidobacterium avesanii]